VAAKMDSKKTRIKKIESELKTTRERLKI